MRTVERRYIETAETHLREVLKRKTCCIFLVELVEDNAYGLLGVGPKHELK